MKTALVVDTCIVLAANFTDEVHCTLAQDFLQENDGYLMASDLIHVEIINGLMKGVRRGRVSAEKAQADWKNIWSDYPWAQLLPTQPHMADALRLSVHHPLHVYDLLHLLAAREAGRTLITLDRKFHEQAKAARLGKWVQVLG